MSSLLRSLTSRRGRTCRGCSPRRPILERLEDRALLSGTPHDVVSSGPSADVIKTLDLVGRGERVSPEATTDVWAMDGFAYLGTFVEPCGDGTGENGSGVRIFDVHNPTKATEVGHIPSVAGAYSNDVKAAHMNSGSILVHSNEPCVEGGPGGFEIWDVENPLDPQHLAHVQTDDINALLQSEFGFVDFGVHNLYLFSQGAKDYVAAVVDGLLGNFQVFEITDPTSPQLVGWWGAEELRMAELGLDPATVPDLGLDEFDTILDLNDYILSGLGDLAFRVLHDVTVSADGTQAYLSNWDAGLVLLDISDPTDPTLISVADPAAGPGGEGNSHAAWPTADGSVVVEATEDFDFGSLAITVDSGPLAGSQFGGVEETHVPPPPRFFDTGPVTGELVFLGQLCEGDPVENADDFDPGDIAVVRRGTCLFSEKILVAQDLGAAAVIIANNIPGADAVRNWFSDDPDVTIPALQVSTAVGDTLEANPTGNIATIDPDVYIDLSPWGFIRIWDYSDPGNPVLASTFNTLHSLNENGPPDPRGTYSVHNVIVEGDRAYISWYSEGVLILDISDPYNPVEIARYHDSGPEFEAQNGGIQDVWGISKVPDQPWIYASDRNGGLYVLKEKGQGLSVPRSASTDIGGDFGVLQVKEQDATAGGPSAFQETQRESLPSEPSTDRSGQDSPAKERRGRSGATAFTGLKQHASLRAKAVDRALEEGLLGDDDEPLTSVVHWLAF